MKEFIDLKDIASGFITNVLTAGYLTLIAYAYREKVKQTKAVMAMAEDNFEQIRIAKSKAINTVAFLFVFAPIILFLMNYGMIAILEWQDAKFKK
jgi:hypothetical protein